MKLKFFKLGIRKSEGHKSRKYLSLLCENVLWLHPLNMWKKILCEKKNYKLNYFVLIIEAETNILVSKY